MTKVVLVMAILLTTSAFVLPSQMPLISNDNDSVYTDIEDSYAKGAIIAWSAPEFDVLKGYGNGLFGPRDNIREIDLNIIFDKLLGKPVRDWENSDALTREQAAKAIAVELGLIPVASPLERYGDHTQIAPEYRPYVYALKESGIQKGDGTNYLPKTPFTREAIIQTLSNSIDALIDRSESEPNYEKSIIIRKAGVVLKDMVVKGDVIIGYGIGENDFTLDNVNIEGRLITFDNVNEINITQNQTDYATPNDYFNNSVFVGDSIIAGIAQYVISERGTANVLGDAKFLSEINGIRVADCAGDMGANTIYFGYRGEERTIEYCVTEMGVSKVFIMLGMNDLTGGFSIVQTIERYCRVIDKINAAAPNVEVIILLNTPKVAGAWLPWYCTNENFNNTLIDEYIADLISMCTARGMKYVDLNSHLKNDQNALPNEWCRDDFVHLNDSSSAVIVKLLQEFAKQNMNY